MKKVVTSDSQKNEHWVDLFDNITQYVEHNKKAHTPKLYYSSTFPLY